MKLSLMSHKFFKLKFYEALSAVKLKKKCYQILFAIFASVDDNFDKFNGILMSRFRLIYAGFLIEIFLSEFNALFILFKVRFDLTKILRELSLGVTDFFVFSQFEKSNHYKFAL